MTPRQNETAETARSPGDTPRPGTSRPDLNALGREALEAFAVSIDEPAYRGRQIFRWMNARGTKDFNAMTDLPAQLRSRLNEVAVAHTIQTIVEEKSVDGTAKTLYRLASGNAVEAVLIPDFNPDRAPKRLTVCVSSQVGCAMDCSFCATGRMGFSQNLTSGEIFDQVYETNRMALSRYGRPLTNIVFMGMGEPLLNYEAVRDSILKITDENGLGMAARRITVSTVGLAGQIRRLAEDNLGCNLAVSLHAPTEEKRSEIMPVNRKAKTDLSALRDSIVYYSNRSGNTVTYEYCLFKDFNDTPEDANELARISEWAPSKVNLIMYNPVEGVPFERADEAGLNRFVRRLIQRGVTVTVRKSRGQDIKAACGQLAGSEQRA